jgi:hypothetical protein
MTARLLLLLWLLNMCMTVAVVQTLVNLLLQCQFLSSLGLRFLFVMLADLVVVMLSDLKYS